MAPSRSRLIAFSRIAVVLFVLLGLYSLLEIYWLPRELEPRDDFDDMTIISPYIAPVPASKPYQLYQTLSENEADSSCFTAPGAEKIMVIVKTGFTELYQKLPMHLLTTFKCIPRLKIFGDLESTLAEYQVVDILGIVGEKYREFQPGFAQYRKLQQYQRDGRDLSQIIGDSRWNIDKWAFLPGLHSAFTTSSREIEWFVFVESDTSLSWTNLLQWLKTMDPAEPLYLGAENVLGKTAFAHAGSGIVISRKAADMLEEVREREGREAYDARWEDDVAEDCCGDEIIARAFLEAGVNLKPAWPLLQSGTIASLNWTDEHWCSPPITWHDVSPLDLDSMWQFERAWVDGHGWDEPYLFRDVFAHFFEGHLRFNRTSWDNLSQDRQLLNDTLAVDGEQLLYDFDREAVESQDGCAAACLHPMYEKCIQWKYSLGRCYLGYTIRFGKVDDREEESWTSGWIQDRVEKFKERYRGCRVRWSGMAD